MVDDRDLQFLQTVYAVGLFALRRPVAASVIAASLIFIAGFLYGTVFGAFLNETIKHGYMETIR